MSSVSSAANQVIQARAAAQNQQIDIALLKKNLDAQKQLGDAAVQLIEQAAEVQKQIASGRLDVKA